MTFGDGIDGALRAASQFNEVKNPRREKEPSPSADEII